MKSELELINHIEAYLRGELSPEEHKAFEKLRNSDPELDHKVVAHHNLMNQIAAYGDYRQLKHGMETIHDQMDIEAMKDEVLPQEVRIRALWKKYRINITVAASIAILATFITLLSTGYFTQSNSDVVYLKRAVDNLQEKFNNQGANNKVVNNNVPVIPSKFAATGFALTTDGYVITNYHIIQGANSVYVQNTDGQSFRVQTIYTDPAYDIAILQITDTAFKSFKALPYTFKKPLSDLGEQVYTLGFPTDNFVLNQGYLSARTGYKGDTTTYQVSIPVNPGNSGGPLLDDKGNIIGIISSKLKQADGVYFAVKSQYLLKSIRTLQDSLDVKLVLNKRNTLGALSHTAQIKKMQNYIFMVKTY
jgi:serine protease Do